MFYVSVLLVELDLTNYLIVSVLLLLGVSTVLLDACDLSVLLTVSSFFFSEIGGVMDSSTTFSFDFTYFSTMSISLI